MGKDNLCTVFSYYKAYHGTTSQGTLLKAFPNRNLCFDGTPSYSDCTVFSRKNRKETCTFSITMDGVKYCVCEVNNTIVLKDDDATVFHVKPVSGLPDELIVLIKTEKSNLYLTSDQSGRPILCPWEAIEGGRTGWFILGEHYDTTDGAPTDVNNNTTDVKPRSKTFRDDWQVPTHPVYARSISAV
ncbi:hypothetical protein QZH41_014965 [Actinostola sp. cb2023]|nr:hypothetical protein QZH41_014965 [Actinostola sp. cb2023]